MSKLYECAKCGLRTGIEQSVAVPTFEIPGGFMAITTKNDMYLFCDSCAEKLKEVLAKTVDEFVEKGADHGV